MTLASDCKGVVQYMITCKIAKKKYKSKHRKEFLHFLNIKINELAWR